MHTCVLDDSLLMKKIPSELEVALRYNLLTLLELLTLFTMFTLLTWRTLSIWFNRVTFFYTVDMVYTVGWIPFRLLRLLEHLRC